MSITYARKACLGFALAIGCGQSAEPIAVSPTEATSKKIPVAQNNSPIDLKVVKYDRLVAAVKAHRGSVVIVDIWGEFCEPCKQEFPHLVQMHRQYAAHGLVCMSVSVDPVDRHEHALRFLQQVGATFENLLLDEDYAVWQERWDLKGVPAVFVFDKDCKRAAKFDNDDPDNQYGYPECNGLWRHLCVCAECYLSLTCG